MIHLAISFLAALVFPILTELLLGHFTWGIVPGVIVAGVVAWQLTKKVNADVNERMSRVQQILTPKTQQQQQKPRFDDAIAVLEGGLKWEKRQPLVAGQIHAQIGTLYYLDKRWEDAERHLSMTLPKGWFGKVMPRGWVSDAMLAAIHYRRKRYDQMKSVFEIAVAANPKEALLWNIWAWCLWEQKDRDGAIGVLVRAVEHVPSDERTRKNLESMQNGKGPKLRAWDVMWYQFHLETPPPIVQNPQFARRATARPR